MEQGRGRTWLAGLTAGALLLTSCSGSDDDTTGDQPARGTTTSPVPPDEAVQTSARPPVPADEEDRTDAAGATSGRPQAAVEVEGVSDPVAELVQELYAGREVPAADEVAEDLAGVEPIGRDLTVVGAEGSWKDEPIAVLTAGDDLTLAVEGDDGWRVVGGVWPSLGLTEPTLGGPRHVLMIGSDAREKRGEPVDRLRADSLQVVGVDGSGGGGVMGIARDSWVDMPDGGQAKINTAMVQAGPEGQVDAVAQATGLPIEGYVLVGFEGFTGFIDDWGGVTIDSPRAFDGFPEGVQELGGYWLLRWSRHRKSLPGGDFDRSFHQGVALAGIGLQARTEGPDGLPDLLTMVEEHMNSNLDAEQVLTFAAWAYLADPADVGHEVAKGGFGWSSDGQSIVLLDDEARATFQDFADGNLG